MVKKIIMNLDFSKSSAPNCISVMVLKKCELCTEILCSFKLVLEKKTGKEIPESSWLEFLEKFSANNFHLSDAEENTPGSFNRGGIADLP